MPGRIFISYRRDDVPGDARGLRDGLAAKFGRSSVFMDVDNLLAGQRFDEELAKALASCDVFLAVLGPRWMEQLKAREGSGERDYVREEIAEALKRRIVVIPVRVGREGQMPPLPRAADLPEDIRDLVLYQKQDVAHERFGRDIAELVSAIRIVRQGGRRPLPRRSMAAAALVAMLGGGVLAYQMGAPMPWDAASSVVRSGGSDSNTANAAATKRKADEEAQAKRAAEEAERQRLATLKAEDDKKRAEAAARRKAEEEAAKRIPRPGQTFRDCPDCPEMVVVPAGEFMMGSEEYSHEEPVHKVRIRAPLAVGKFEVTFQEWEACVAGDGCRSNPTPSDAGWGKGRRPVINVSWNHAKEYAAWLSRKTGKNYRLLTEAEWEYAARAGTTTRYSWGNDIGKGNANCDGCGSQWDNKQTAPAGSFKPNTFGLHDMHGSVWEWVEDCYQDDYNGAPSDGSARTGGSCDYRPTRGGSWNTGLPRALGSASRYASSTVNRARYLGFRVARTLDR